MFLQEKLRSLRSRCYQVQTIGASSSNKHLEFSSFSAFSVLEYVLLNEYACSSRAKTLFNILLCAIFFLKRYVAFTFHFNISTTPSAFYDVLYSVFVFRILYTAMLFQKTHKLCPGSGLNAQWVKTKFLMKC